MTKYPRSQQLVIMMLASPMFPLMQGHGMTEEMQERMRPKRHKRKYGGKVPGYRSGGRADRRRRR
jgi:hypothetical protein